MAEARERSEWNRFSVLIAKIHNVNQVKKSGLITFKQAHPFYMQEANEHPRSTQGDLALAKSLIGSVHHG